MERKPGYLRISYIADRSTIMKLLQIHKYFLILLLLFAGCSSDYFTKKWAQRNLRGKSSVTMIRGFIDLGFTENKGMVFGILNNSHMGKKAVVLTIFRLIISAAILIAVFLSPI